MLSSPPGFLHPEARVNDFQMSCESQAWQLASAQKEEVSPLIPLNSDVE
jgi:hypothetical protein